MPCVLAFPTVRMTEVMPKADETVHDSAGATHTREITYPPFLSFEHSFLHLPVSFLLFYMLSFRIFEHRY